MTKNSRFVKTYMTTPSQWYRLPIEEKIEVLAEVVGMLAQEITKLNPTNKGDRHER